MSLHVSSISQIMNAMTGCVLSWLIYHKVCSLLCPVMFGSGQHVINRLMLELQSLWSRYMHHSMISSSVEPLTSLPITPVFLFFMLTFFTILLCSYIVRTSFYTNCLFSISVAVAYLTVDVTTSPCLPFATLPPCHHASDVTVPLELSSWLTTSFRCSPFGTRIKLVLIVGRSL